MNRLVLIDTLNFFHRAFHAYPPQLTTLQGEPINAVYGFAAMLVALAEELKPTHLAVAYESEKEPTFRALEFPAYKATRVPLPPEEQAQFDSQLPLLEQFLKAAKIAALRAEGFEADDLIGTMCSQLTNQPATASSGAPPTAVVNQLTEIIIASNDRDLMQLIGPRVRFYLPAVGSKQKAKLYTEKDFFEEYGFKPPAIVDYKALRGDPSDNIPGVRGIGEKTATDLIRRYGSVDEIYRHVLDLPTQTGLKPSVVIKLNDGRKDAELSRKLATIVTDAPVEFDWEELRFEGFDRPEVRALFEKWGFKSLLKKIAGEEPLSEDRDQLKLI